MSRVYDIIIVGDGILGYATAFSLLQRNSALKIVIVGNQNKNAATISAGAMVSCFSEITHGTFSNQYSKAKFEMGLNALKAWPNWIDSINQYGNYNLHLANGTYVLLNSKSGVLDSKNFLAMKQALKNYGQVYEEISPEDVPNINPTDAARPLQAIYIPDEGYIDPISVKGSLKNILHLNFKVKFINSKVQKIIYSNFSADGICLEDNEVISGNKIILTTGAHTQFLINDIPEIKHSIPLTLAGAGYALLLKTQQKNIQHVIRTPNRAGSCGLHALPRDNSSIYIGATNNVYLTPQRNMSLGLAQFLMKCAIEQIDQNFYNAQIIDWIVGNRPVTIDTFPLIGETSIKNLIILSGTYREGFHLSPYLSEYIADQVLSETKKNNFFAPERKLITTMTQQESIQEYLLHYQSGCYEHGMNLPLFMSEKNFINRFRDQINDLYNQLEINFGLMPEILLMMLLPDDNREIVAKLKKYFNQFCMV